MNNDSRRILSILLVSFFVSSLGCPGVFRPPPEGQSEGEVIAEGEGATTDGAGEGEAPTDGEGEGQSKPEGQGEGDGEGNGVEIRVIAELLINDLDDEEIHRGEGNAILITEDGNFVIVGASLYAADEVTIQHSLILEATAEGAPIWWSEVGDGYNLTTLYDLAEAPAGGYVAAGTIAEVDLSSSASAYLVNIDKAGTAIWSRTYGNEDGMTTAVFRGLLALPDGGYLCAGHVRTRDNLSVNLSVYIVQTDENGSEVWSKTFVDTRFRSATSVAATSDGGYLVSGNEGTTEVVVLHGGGDSVFLLKLDESGAELWTRTYLQGEISGVANVISIEDGGAVVAGTLSSGDSTDSDIILLKVDAEGNVVWTVTYDSGEGDDTAAKVRATPGGGFIVAGDAPPGPYVVRVDEDGIELGALVHPVDHGEHLVLRTPIKDIRIVSEGVYVLVGFKELPEIAESGSPSDIYVLKLAEE